MSIDENKAIVCRFFEEAWNRGNLDTVEEVIADNATLSFRGQIMTPGHAGTRAIIQHWRTAFPDFHFEVAELIGEDDIVAARVPFTGTHLGQLMDIPPTGRFVQVSETMLFRVAGGIIVEAWEDYDELGMRQQLGVAQT